MNALDVFAEARPEVADLDPALRSTIADALFGAGSTASSGEMRASVAVVGAPSPDSRARWLVAAAAAAVVVLVVGLVVVAGDRDAEAPATPLTELPAAPVEPLRLLPGDTAPYSFDGFVRERWSNPVGRYVVLARPDGAGGYSDPIWVSRSPRDEVALERIGPAVEFGAGGRRVEFREDLSSGYRLVVFETGDGTDISLVAYRQGPPGFFRDQLASIGVTLDLTSPAIELGAPPDGYVVVASGQFAQETVRSLDVQRDGAPFMSVATRVGADAGFPFFNMGEHIAPVVVRGKAGWVTTSTWQAPDGPWQQPRLMWEERPGQWVQVNGADVITLEELGGFAASLVEVDAETYAAVVDEEGSLPPPGTDGTPSTTAPMTESGDGGVATTVPATTMPAGVPPGRVLVVNASNMAGLAGQTTEMLRRDGTAVLDPVNAVPDGVAAGTVMYVRPGSEALGSWVTARFAGAHAVVPLDELDATLVEGGIRDADVVLVLGLDAVPDLTGL